ncbi:MAG: HU family DNA-binding protein [Blautia sp.]|nr:HU family DNA-binding protein [Blautia sp.]
MNKTELISAISIRTGMPQDAARKAWDAAIETISNELAGGGTVIIPGFGTFSVKHRSARKGVNPQSGEQIEIPSSDVPSFKPGKALKAAVNK